MTAYSHDGEREPDLAALTDTDILTSFRDALVLLYPTLLRMKCVQDDSQTYDDFDTLVETLWEVLVIRTLAWRDGVHGTVTLPPYGLYATEPAPLSYIAALTPAHPTFRFVAFTGDRAFGPALFNSVDGVSASGAPVSVPFDASVQFTWIR